MNFWMLCFFGLVPFHHAAVHQADLTVCPDYAQIRHWGEEILACPIYAEPLVSESDSESNPETEAVTKLETELDTKDSVCFKSETSAPEGGVETFEPCVDPYVVRKNSIRHPAILTISEDETVPLTGTFSSASGARAGLEADLPLNSPSSLSAPSLSHSSDVRLAVAEERIPSNSPVESNNTVATNASVSPAVESETLVPVRRPWGALTFCVFLLLLSVSANVFLGWQLAEARRMKMK